MDYTEIKAMWAQRKQRILRLRKQMTLTEIAKLYGVSRQRIHQILHGGKQ